MCTRKPDEPLWSYAFRQFCEKPHAVIGFLAMASCFYMYTDMRSLFKGAVSEITGMKHELVELNLRMARLEQMQRYDNK